MQIENISYEMKTKKKRNWTPFLFLLPGMTVLAVIFLLPVGFAIVVSFLRFNLNVPDFGLKFVGFDNFLYIFQDQLMLKSIEWTFRFTAIVVTLEVALGMIWALMLNSSILGRMRDPLRALFLIPMLMSGVLVSHMWRIMFDATFGPINHLITTLGFDKVQWGADALTAQAMIIITDIWWATPFVMLVLLAGLQNIPDEILEAASIDGANNWEKFTHIIVPYLKFPLMVVTIIRTMDALRIFDQIYVLTSGGPGSATTTIMFYNYRYAFSYFQLGRASAMSFAFLIIIAIISYIYTQVLRRQVEQ